MSSHAPDDVPAEVEIDERLVRRLIAEQHPDLAGPVTSFSEGWDNRMFRLGSEHLVRMPRRAMGEVNLRKELDLVPRLPRLPVPVPVPVAVGEPTRAYPFHWSIVPYVEGEVLGTKVLEPADLLGVLQALHVPCPDDVPDEAARSCPLDDRDPLVQRRLHHLEPATRAQISSIWESARRAAAHAGPRCWVHGDLHPFNLVTRGERLAAVLDWGDVFGGDPSPDLAGVWMALDIGYHQPFHDHAGEARWARGRGWAVYFGLVLVDAAARGASRGFGEVGQRCIERLCEAGPHD